MTRISIVTPSYNQAQFLESTIENVSQQNHGNLEHIVIDGGSTDGSVEILERYSDRLAYWVSEPDEGQCHAINKGFAKATGDIHYWLCADDALADGALALATELLGHQEGPAWLVGAAHLIRSNGRIFETRTVHEVDRDTFLRWPSNWIPTQAVFWNREMWEAAGPFDEKLHFVMDLALWHRMYNVCQPVITQQVLGLYRFHSDAKSIARMDESKSERRAYLETLAREEWRSALQEGDTAALDQLISEYAGLLEEASDYRATLDEVNDHRLFGPLLNLWRRVSYPRFGKV